MRSTRKPSASRRAARGVGSLRGQIAVALTADDDDGATWIEYTVWATVSGPLAGLPPHQIENVLREVADDFFAEFCEVVRAKHGLPSVRGVEERWHVFLRPGAMAAVMSRRSGATARAARTHRRSGRERRAAASAAGTRLHASAGACAGASSVPAAGLGVDDDARLRRAVRVLRAEDRTAVRPAISTNIALRR